MSYKKPFVLIFALLALSIFAYQKLSFEMGQAQAQTAQKIIKSEEKVRQEMIVLSRQIGVTCTECHNVQDFKNGDKKNFKVGLEHMRLTDLLRENGMNGKNNSPEASCFMCHQGKLHYPYKERSKE